MPSTGAKTSLTVGALLGIVTSGSVALGGVDTSGGPDTGETRSIARSIVSSQYGWDGNQWDCLETLWQNESNWEADADNPTSSAYGIPQALTSLHDLPAGYSSSARVQITWGLAYIDGRYGSPCSALQAWESRDPHWY